MPDGIVAPGEHEEVALSDEPFTVRFSGRRDRAALGRLGHTPDVVRVLCPSAVTRLAWATTGTVVRSLVAEEVASGVACGSVQLVRSRLDDDTWMFGHWRVAAGRRREGIGRRLLSGARALLPGVRRLYSLVDWGNDASLSAHRHLGFDVASPLLGSARLAALSTMGPPTPAVRLERTSREKREALFSLYARAMGRQWMELFPRLNSAAKPHLRADPVIPGGRTEPRPPRLFGKTLMVYTEGVAVGFVVRGRDSYRLFSDPDVCDTGLLARVALQMIERGAPRLGMLRLLGLPQEVVERPGPIAARTLMALGDTGRLSR